jgi:RNA polymerase sigma-70 factor (ECF subfamily)
MPQLPENPLYKQAITGDDVALQQLLLKHHKTVVAHINNRLADKYRRSGLAEDVAQEAYVAVFRDIGAFKPGADLDQSFLAWVVRIADHRMLDMLKRMRAAKRGGGKAQLAARNRDGDEAELVELLAATTVSRTPSRSIVRREAIEVVQKALEELKPVYREALQLRYIQGLAVADAAERLGRSPGAVLLLCNRGLKHLRAAIASHWTSRIQKP